MEVKGGIKNKNTETDSDLNINSWVFVEKRTEEFIDAIAEENPENYDSISDSDGISVISETEIETEESQDGCCICTSEIVDRDIETPKKETINTSKSDDNICQELSTYKNLQLLRKESETKSNLFMIATIIGMCSLAIYLLWPKPVEMQDFASDIAITLKHDYSKADMTYFNFLDDIYDNEIWVYYGESNNTCNSDLSESNTAIIQQSLNDIKKDHTFPIMSKSIQNRVSNNIYQKYLKDKNNKDKKKEHKKFKHKTKTLKLKENYLNKKNKYLISKEKYLKKLEKEIRKLKVRLLQSYHVKKSYKVYKPKKFKDHLELKHKNGTLDAEWYHKMYSERSQQRSKEKLSDWMFERSRMRTKLREKDGWSWYFARARSRAHLRDKFYPKKYKIYRSYHLYYK